MSAPAKLTKKQKKALAFRERKGKGKASVTEENDVPVVEDQDVAEAEVADSPVESQERVKTQDKSRAPVVEGKKRKREEASESGEHEDKTKSKKKKKGPEPAATVSTDGDQDEGGEGKSAKGTAKGKQQRFILFVGNLKYTTTKEAVAAHFASCDPPPTVRLMTPKPSANGKSIAKSKGFAFLEFSAKSGLQQALKLHQSQLEGRMINVELTAGGGGKSESRLAKVRERNKELHEQRKKKLEVKKKKKGSEPEISVVDLERPQRYSATSGVTQAPTKKRTWSVAEETDVEPKKKKRGSKKPPKALGTGVNAIPVG